jgi:hypothetical protein
VYVPLVSLEGVQALQDGGLRDEVLALNKRQKIFLRGRLFDSSKEGGKII